MSGKVMGGKLAAMAVILAKSYHAVLLVVPITPWKTTKLV
jgi:hypothetical protein